MRTLLYIGLGGFLGSVLRYLAILFFRKFVSDQFPYGVMFVNIAGSFVIGILFAMSERSQLMDANVRLFLTVGLCGGFTTFSTFSLDTVTLYNSSFISALLYLAGSVLLGILAVAGGYLLVR